MKSLEEAAEKADEFFVMSLQIIEGQIQSESDLVESEGDVLKSMVSET